MSAAPLIELLLLGPASVRMSAGRDAGGVLAQPKRFALLAYLAAATPYGFHRRDTLLALLWPEADQEHARTALRKATHFLRQEGGQDVVVSRGHEELGVREDVLWCDVREFDRSISGGNLRDALALYRGDLLPGFFISNVPEFERWLEDERSCLRAKAAETASDLAGRLEKSGDADGATRWARWACTQALDDERAVRRLIGLLDRSGDRAGALCAYEEFAERLKSEYDVTPSAETQELVRGVRAGLAGAATMTGPPRPAAVQPTARDPGAAEALSTRSSSRQYVAILPFTVHGDGSAAYLREGLVDLLSTSIDHAGPVHSIDPHALLSLVAREGDGHLDPDRAGALAQHFGAQLYVLGSIVGVGGQLRISAALHRREPGDTSARYISVTGPADHLFELVDDLTAKLLAELHPGPGARLARLATTTTASLDALKTYLAGEKALRVAHYVDAVEAFQHAVEQDPDFALAWYRLAFFLSWPALPQPNMSPEIAERALQHKERLSHHDRLLLEALHASLRGAANEAEHLYQEILALHPEDVEAWIGLGQTLVFHNQHRGRRIIEARGPIERALALDPGNATATLFLCYVAHLEGNLDEGDSLIESAPAQSDFVHPRIVQAFGRGDRDRQEQAIAFLSSAPDVAVCEATRFVATLTFNFPGARRIAELLTHPARSPDVHGVYHILSAFLDVAAGSWTAARQELIEAAALRPAEALEYQALLATLPFLPIEQADLDTLRKGLAGWEAGTVPHSTHQYSGFDLHFDLHYDSHPVLRLYLLGGLSGRLGDTAALAYAGELDTIRGGTDAEGLARDLAHSVRAQNAFWRGEPTAALAALEQARMQPRQIRVVLQSPFYTQTAERWLRAELLQRLGRLDVALRWYESLVQASLYDLIYLAPSHLRRGEICEHLGRREAAVEHYRHVVELWHGCDPELRPMVEQARAGIDRLSSG